MNISNKYTSHTFILCIDDYITSTGQWDDCPCCRLKPKIWIFDNGRSTACGCWDNKYDHFSVYAESIMSIYKHDGNTLDHDSDGLRKNWNHWCKTGIHLFAPS